MKNIQKQSQKLTITGKIVITGIIGIVVFTVVLLSGIFDSKESKAIPSNAAEFSETCYSIADGGAGLYEFNKYTGNPSSPGNTGIGSPEASTLNLVGDTLFVIDGSAGEFGYVDLTNGSWTVLNTTFENTELNGAQGKITFDDIDGMTVDNNDILWVASRDNSDTYPSFLAQMTHSGEFIKNAFGIGIDYVQYDGPDGFPSVIDAMGYDPIDDVLYVCANDGSGNPSYNNLMKVNPTNGVGTLVGNFNVGDVEGLGFDGEGNMYITTGMSSNTTSNRNSFYSVNKYTAVATKVFTFSSGTDFETCDCIIGYKNTIKGTVFNDIDENGFLGDGESGYAGVTVSLYYDENDNGQYDVGTDGFVRSVVTNEVGEYTLFDAYSYGTMNYVMTINTAGLPSGYTLTTDNIESSSFSTGGNTVYNKDFGYKMDQASHNTISGYVYKDDDQDQVFDGSEVGIEGTKVYLYQDINGNGVYDVGTDLIVTSKLTDVNGAYSFVRPFIGGTIQVTSQISSSNADAEQSGSSVTTSSSDMDLGDETVGLHFTGLAIPNGAVIENAYLEFTSNEVRTSVTTIDIYGEDEDNATIFSSSSNNISTRTTTTANKNWIIPYWSATGIKYNSPSIATVVQEIVDRNGWSSGNNLNIIIPNNTGHRSAVSYNTAPADAPIIYITYSDPQAVDNYLTFVDATTLPTGSEFTTDNIETSSFNSGGNTDPNNNFGVYQDLSSFNTISGTVFYDENGDAVYNGSDLGENNISVCLFDDINGNGTYEGATDQLLQIKKTGIDGTYLFQQPFATTTGSVTSQVDRSSDDARDDKDKGKFKIDKTELKLGKEANVVRFNGIDIPQGATITSASINFTSDGNKSGAFSTVIVGIDHDNTPTIVADQNPNSFNTTTASVSWSSSTDWETDVEYQTPSLTSIVSEIVSRNGWSSGNSMGFIFNDGSGERNPYAYDESTSRAPEISIAYEINEVNYVVIIKEDNLPNGYELTTDNLESASFTSGGNTDANNDFGYELNTVGMNIISGNVFNDANQDATKNVDETDIAGIKINLYADEDCDGVLDNGEPRIATTTTNIDGNYQFNESFGVTIERRISQSSDDADEGTLSLTSSDLDLAQSKVAVRFNNLAIPQGVTITSAYIVFTAEATKTGSYSFNVDGVDVDNASTFTEGQNLNLLSKTTATALMSGSNDWELNGTYNSPSLALIVQEIVDRGGWTSGNSMAFVFGTGTGDRDAYSYDQSAGSAPQLVVSYQPSQLCYITEVDAASISEGGALTTPTVQTASFSSSDNTDANNDFGLYYAPLPVELLYFNANWIDDAIQLSWLTATEINNDYFEIQWSADGISYESVGSVAGNGNSIDENSYSFIHSYPLDNNYYRLKQHDYDGAYEYSPTIILNRSSENKSEISALPNPFNDKLSINISSATTTNGQLEIRSIEGRVVYSSNLQLIKGNQSIPIDNAIEFENGSYIVILNTGTEVLTQKLIKR